jgi:hypothetical protein
VTSRETSDIFASLHTKMSLLYQRMLMSLPSYLVLKPALIWMVLVRSSASICTTLASSSALVPDMESMARLVKESGALRHNTFSSVVVTMVVASLMLLYS